MPLVEAFLAALRPTARELVQPPDLEQPLELLVREAEAPWPFRIPASRYIGYVAERIEEGAPLLEALGRLHHQDLYLACGCSLADPRAMEAFDGACSAAVSTVLARLRVPGHEAEEVLQELRGRLFVAEGRPPVITQYRGRGRLAEWVRVACLRAVLKRRAGQHRELAIDDEALAAMPAVDPDPELRYLKENYRREFREAFREALSAISKRQRALLRLHFFREMTVDRLGAVFHVHRSTAARWLAEARQALLDRTRAALCHRLGLEEGEWESVMRLIESRLEVSFRDLLGERR